MAAKNRTLKVYEAADGFRWNLRYGGKILAESGEAYTKRSDAEKAGRGVFSDYPIRLVIERLRDGKMSWVHEQLR